MTYVYSEILTEPCETTPNIEPCQYPPSLGQYYVCAHIRIPHSIVGTLLILPTTVAEQTFATAAAAAAAVTTTNAIKKGEQLK